MKKLTIAVFALLFVVASVSEARRHDRVARHEARKEMREKRKAAREARKAEHREMHKGEMPQGETPAAPTVE
jgi:Ni/Co efflux regulator RcnB